MGRRPGKKATTPSALPQSCSKSDLAHILGISVRSVTDWDQKGVFQRAVGRGRYELVPSVNGYTSALREQAAGRASATGLQLTDERALTEKVVRQIKERELANLIGETLTLVEVTESWTTFATSVKASILSLPGKARSTIPHLTAHDADVLKRICRDILQDLSEEASVVGADASEISGGK